MTENKRFNVFDVDGTVFLEDHKEGSYHIGEKENVDIPCLNDIADRLNKLTEENRHLRKLADIGQTEPYAIVNMLNLQQKMIQDLKREKSDLKEELRVYRQVANCHNCEYHDYDWFDDGDEFEVCRKGNDVTEGICKDWEEL